MKNKYNPYPVNNYRVGTMEYEDYFEYEEKFYNNPEFHEERIENGKRLLKASKVKTALASAIGSVTLLGGVLHIANIVSPLRNITSSPVTNLFINGSAAIICAYTTVKLVKEGIAKEVVNQSNITEDMEVSKKMIKSIRNKRV